MGGSGIKLYISYPPFPPSKNVRRTQLYGVCESIHSGYVSKSLAFYPPYICFDLSFGS